MYMENISHHKDFTRSKPGDVPAFLCHFLADRNIKPRTVLKAANLPPDDLHDDHALKALYEAAAPYMPDTIVTDTDSAATDSSYDSQASYASETSP
jgi:hypothetical protein